MTLASYTVKQGEDVKTILLREFGSTKVDVVRNHPKNAELFKTRTDSILYPGDILYIPEERLKATRVASGNSYTFHPDLYYKFFYSFRIPDVLKDDSYRYSIERIINGSPVESRYYYYLKYPIVQDFSVNSEIKNDVDSLPPEYLIQYLHIDRNNTLKNGYNFLFFSSSGLASFVIGMLFYHVIHLGTISTIIYTVSFISSGVGISAAGYYGYHYMKTRGKLQRILEINKGISINGGIRDKKVNAEVEFSF